MAQPEEGQGIPSKEGNGGDQTEGSASAKSWINQVKSKFIRSNKMWPVSGNVCIYGVAEPLRNSKVDAYDPLVVSFGPYHHNSNPKFSKMDDYKIEAINRVLARSQLDITILIAEIHKLESKIRECYAEPIEWDGETLSWMLAMDACFILEFLRNSGVIEMESMSFSHCLVFQRAHKNNTMFYAILSDIIKLENQIPLFVLIEILKLECGSEEDARTMLVKMLSNYDMFYGYPFLISGDYDAKSKLVHMLNGQLPYHLLDLCRKMIKDLLTNSSVESASAVKPDSMQRLSCIDMFASPSSNRMSVPSAKLLIRAGIRLQPGPIGFEKRTCKLCLPQITVNDDTETLLRNLIAYEDCQKCSSLEETLISDYISFLNSIIDSEKDFSVLQKSLVIKSFLCSDRKTICMLKKLTKDITVDSGFQEFELMLKEALDYSKSRQPLLAFAKQLREDYFSERWAFPSFVAAVLALGLTCVQTVYSIK